MSKLLSESVCNLLRCCWRRLFADQYPIECGISLLDDDLRRTKSAGQPHAQLFCIGITRERTHLHAIEIVRQRIYRCRDHIETYTRGAWSQHLNLPRGCF